MIKSVHEQTAEKNYTIINFSFVRVGNYEASLTQCCDTRVEVEAETLLGCIICGVKHENLPRSK
jgi:hypothetical protein